ncbi:hypothetical protein NGRA_2475 [Nosema granulosis]|uniref:CCHC-type domain-containing protein n=1 Tax=Nosema granulosis TaxID=83296 RepID=A0A9P6KYL5_9MICR|nr:hypothetical protein NGRA_2475 [Nosema granulosis]
MIYKQKPEDGDRRINDLPSKSIFTCKTRQQQKAERIRLYRERRLARERSQCFICERFGHHARECRSNKVSKLKDEQTEHRSSTKITVHKNREEIIKTKPVQEEIKKVGTKTGKDS